MGFLDFFRPLKSIKETMWKELGTFTANFAPFGSDMYANDLVRSCVRALARHTKKATAVCSDERIGKLLNTKPNMYMTGPAMLDKVRTQLELRNTAFIYIQRDDKARVTGFYPVPFSSFEAIDYSGRLFIKFFFKGGTVKLTLPWEDLIPLRNDYRESDIAGDDNGAILKKLDLIYTTEQGLANAVKATANLRGILKSTKAMLSADDIKKQKERFVTDYLNLENEGGIASLDATQEFTPITMAPMVANSQTTEDLKKDIMRYFGVNDSILMSNYTEEQMEAFYSARIEPFLIELSEEMTRKVFTEREQGYGNRIVYEANRLQFASMKTKISIYKEVVLNSGMTINEWRIGCNMAPVPWGDKPIRRLDVGDVNKKEPNNNEDEPST